MMAAFLPLACLDLCAMACFQAGAARAAAGLVRSCVLWPVAGVWASRQSLDRRKVELLVAKIKIQVLRHGVFSEVSALPTP